jgi:hypothetical protein
MNKTRTKDDNYFRNINTEAKAYLLGFIAADGYVSNKPSNKSLQISISNEDREILEFAKKEFKYDGNIEERWIGLNSRCIRIRIYGEKFVNNIIKYGFDNTKTYRFHLPILEKKFYKHFIRGYFDGDGCIYFSKRKFSNKYRYAITIVGTENFCNELDDFINKNLEITFTKIIHITLQNTKIITLRSERIFDIKKFLNYIYKNSSIFLTRKWKKYQELLKIHDEHNQERRKQFTPQQIRTIRNRLKNKETIRSIAKDFGVTHGAIQGIKTGKSYSYIYNL